MKTMVYVCFPFRSNPKANTEKAKEISSLLWKQGYIPVCPHLATGFFKPEEIEALTYCIELLKRCDVLLICGDHISSGMKTEIAWWSQNGKHAIWFWDMNKNGFQELEGSNEIIKSKYL